MQTEMYTDSGVILKMFFTGTEADILNAGRSGQYKDLKEFGFLERSII
jgi:hypothetical protein